MNEFKILHIIPSLGSGGAERMLSKIVNSQPHYQHIIVSLNQSNIIYDFRNSIIINLNGRSFKGIMKLVNIVKNENPLIINTWMNANVYGGLLKLFNRKAKLIFNIRHDIKEDTGVKGLIQWVIKKSSYVADLCIFVSNSSYKNHMIKDFNTSNSLVIPNCFDTYQLKSYKIYEKDKLIIGYVGRLSPLKNQEKLLNIIKNVLEIDNNIEIWLAGKDLEDLPFKNYTKYYSRVKFFGEVTNLNKFYQSINLLILTSKKEGFPNVIGEAMSFGVPVATTDAGDSYDIIGESGYKIENDKTDENISKELYQLLSNEELLMEKSKESKLRIQKKYESSKILKDIEYIYKNIGGVK